MNDITFEIVTNTPLVETCDHFFAGVMNGLLVTVEHIPSRSLLEIRFGATRLTDDDLTDICQAFKEYIDSRKSHLQIDENSICILLQIEANWRFRFSRILETIERIGMDMNIESGCYLCGETQDDIRPYEIESLRAYLCPACAKRTTDDLCESLKEKTEDNRFTRYASSDISEKELFLPGSIAALVGALVGMMILFLLGMVPFGLFPAGIILSFLIFFAYRKFAGIIKVRGLLICLGMLAVFLFFGLSIVSTPQIVSSINRALGPGSVSVGSVLLGYIGYLNHPNVPSQVSTDFALACVSAGITAIIFVFASTRKNG